MKKVITKDVCLARIKELIPDDTVKDFVFGFRYKSDDFLDTADEINGYYSRVLNLAFSLIYLKYYKWKYPDNSQPRTEIDLKDVKSLNSFRRISRTLTELYSDKGLNYSIIEPTIMDIQLDEEYSGAFYSKMGFGELFSKDKKHRFASFTRQAAISRDSTRGDGSESMDLEEKYSDLIEFIKLFPFLSSLRLELEKITPQNYGKAEILYEQVEEAEGGSTKSTLMHLDADLYNVILVLVDDVEDERLDSNLTLINSAGLFYYLQDILRDHTSREKEVTLRCNYAAVGRDDDFYRVNVTSDKSFIARDTETVIFSDSACSLIIRELHLDISDRDRVYLIKDFYAINYRYVKPLTLSICDILKADDENSLKEYYLSPKFKNRYKELFEFATSWDTKIAVLIVKESATNILKILFKNRPDAYLELFSSLHSRLGGDVFEKEKLLSIIREEQEIAFNRWKVKYFGTHQDDVYEYDSGSAVSEERKVINAEVCAVQLISYLTEILKVDDARDKQYKNNYPLNINSHIRMLENLKDSGFELDKIKKRAVSIVCNTLRVLYLFYCGFFKYVGIKSKYKAESKKRVIPAKEIRNYQNKANEAFREEVRLRVAQLNVSGVTIANLLSLLEKMNEECKFSKNENHKNMIIREYLGRYQLFDYSRIAPLLSLTDFTENDDEVTVRKKIDGILDVYEYFKEGDDNYSEVDSIYPYVGTYEYSHETRDGYKIAHFSMSSARGDIFVEVLSEFQYSVNSKYYCLPNKLCCENDKIKLWIEPTIIDYRQLVEVDEFFRDSAISDQFSFERLEFKDDYWDTAKLIYNTDPYIYRDLFGDEENCYNVLSFSFDNPTSLFYKKYVYIVRDKKTKMVVGTSLFHPEEFLWNSESMEKDFEKAEVPRPESFSAVSRYLTKTYNTAKIGGSVCNISINSNYRRRGIGVFMLRKLIEAANGKAMGLTVLKSNVAAINLYAKLGFRITGESFEDYGNGSAQGVESYIMRRDGN